MPVPLRIDAHGPPDGTPVVLLHGFPLDRTMWGRQVEALTEIGCRVLLPDLRGFGETAGGDAPATMRAMAEDVLATLDREGVDRFVLGGFSMGGYVALEMWRAAPERLRALLLVDTRAEADSAEARHGRARTAAQVRSEGTGALADSMLPKLLSPTTVARNPALVREVREMMERQKPEPMARALEAMAEREDFSSRLQEVDVPALVIVGADDAIAPPDIARRMRDAIPRADVEVIPMAGHLAPMENSWAFNTALVVWLQDTLKPRGRERARTTP